MNIPATPAVRNLMGAPEDMALEQISIGERLRKVNDAFVDLIGVSFIERGQDTPIIVGLPNAQGKNPLIAGAHRFAAAQKIGWARIKVVPFMGSVLEAELLEVEENLIRRELSPLDRAVFLAKHKDLYQKLHPQAKRGGDRRSDQRLTMSLWSGGFEDTIRDRLNLSKATVNRSIRIAKYLPREVRDAIAGTDIADSFKELLALTRVPVGELGDVAEIIASRGISSVAEAVRIVRNVAPPKVDADEQAFQKLLVGWMKASAKARGRFIAHLRESEQLDDGPPKARGRKAAAVA